MPDLSAEALIEVPFHDVDVMDVAWHGHYVKYLELARCALLRQIDYDYPQMRDSGYAWPVVEKKYLDMFERLSQDDAGQAARRPAPPRIRCAGFRYPRSSPRSRARAASTAPRPRCRRRSHRRVRAS